ncbi:clampless protein 1 [Cryptococcus bacillisporus CA1873]|uniref:Clampless protein 1 n=1 Tax=Cryptococcus bacillisporus CA1873 TaxID=1296111 RepID=A0ABR5B4R9_CRYGA|nr:clampless protein 1 [Cryptococcus bacillisporus CA1873]|eukprot:KIR58581.1 clampless protein 1 [Cryptococcus gattii CA1873]
MTTYLSPRVFSNKENSAVPGVALSDIDAISLSLRTSLSGVTLAPKKKSAALGLGRAPKFTYRRHSNKPYNRSTSITRAKKAAAQAKGARPKVIARQSKTKPPPLKLAQGPDGERARLERLRKAVWNPPVPIPGQVKIPLKLPYPRFPPFEHIDNEDLKGIPVQYIFDRLVPFLPAIATINLAYRIYASISHPDPKLLNKATFAFAIPEVVDGSKSHWAEKARGREPDLALAVVGITGEGSKGNMVVAVNSLVFAVQCAYWPRLMTTSIPISAPKRPAPSESTVSASLPDIVEPEEGDSDTSISSSYSDDNSEVEFVDLPRLPRPIKDDKGFLHLPLVRLPIPSPSTFPIIHRHLHHPSRALIPDLLGLPEHCTTRPQTLDAISGLSVQQLMDKLTTLHGVWQNLCSLGFGRLESWAQLGEAWVCVVGVIAGHGLLVAGQEEAAMQRTGRKTAAEDVAWEWVRRQKAKEQQ